MSNTDKVQYEPAQAAEVLRFQQQRIVTSLFRSYLILLEDLGLAHDEALAKLAAALPPEYQTYLDLADYLTPEKGKQLRKKVLDAGGDASRALDDILKSFVISFR